MEGFAEASGDARTKIYLTVAACLRAWVVISFIFLLYSAINWVNDLSILML